MDSPTTLDLFCGAGGITEGFRQAGFLCLFGNDISSHAIETFHLNHPQAHAALGPIEDLDPRLIRQRLGLAPGELSCLVGGPPCQGFSINAPERFLEDPRNSLFRHYVRFVTEFAPRTLLLENVPGMLSLEGGHIAKQIVREFQKLGYDVAQRILFAAHYGVPQERWRLILLASRVGSAPEHPSPRHYATARANFTGGSTLTFKLADEDQRRLLPRVTVAEALGDLPALCAGGGAEVMEYAEPALSPYARRLRTGSPFVFNHYAPRIAPINLERLRHIPPGGSWRDVPFELLPAGMMRARRSDHTRRYGRLQPDGLSGTVMTKMDPHWGPAFHYAQDRTLTVREAARLQSFPDRYRFSGPRVSQYEQVGNAVPVLLATELARAVKRSLEVASQEMVLSAGGF